MNSRKNHSCRLLKLTFSFYFLLIRFRTVAPELIDPSSAFLILAVGMLAHIAEPARLGDGIRKSFRSQDVAWIDSYDARPNSYR